MKSICSAIVFLSLYFYKLFSVLPFHSLIAKTVLLSCLFFGGFLGSRNYGRKVQVQLGICKRNFCVIYKNLGQSCYVTRLQYL